MKCTFRAGIAAGHKYDDPDPLGSQIREFEENIGLRYNSSDYAIEKMKEWYKMIGKEWDETPVTESYVVTAKGEKHYVDSGLADLNVEYAGMDDLNKRLSSNTGT